MPTRGTELGSINKDLQSGWRKASRSYGGGNCVEVATDQAGVLVRDSKKPADGNLVFSRKAWAGAMRDVKLGKLPGKQG